MKQTSDWSNDWNSSKNPSKQRKYRENAPHHVKDKLVSANLDPELREELGTRSIKIRTGDRVRVMRGDRKGAEGIVNEIDSDEKRVYVNGITVERQNGTESQIPLRPSNLQVVALNIDDNVRMDKYDIDDIGAIGVEQEEMEEALEEDEEQEMMQKMQQGQTSHEDHEEDEDEEETEDSEEDEETETENEAEEPEEQKESGTEVDYKEITAGTVSDAKDELNDMEGVDWEAALDAEKEGKNRKTLVEWLENKVDN